MEEACLPGALLSPGKPCLTIHRSSFNPGTIYTPDHRRNTERSPHDLQLTAPTPGARPWSRFLGSFRPATYIQADLMSWAGVVCHIEGRPWGIQHVQLPKGCFTG